MRLDQNDLKYSLGEKMATATQLLDEVANWNPHVVSVAKNVLETMAHGESEDQFKFYTSSGNVYYAIVDVIRNIAYIDAPNVINSADQAREMMSLQSQFVRDYLNMDLIINIERVTPKLNDLLSLDLLKLAIFTKKVEKIYIIGNQESFNSFVAAAINIHKKVVDAGKFARYESLDDLGKIIKEIEQGL